jgi:hypothetical protein
LSRRVDVHRLAVNKHCCKTFAEERSAIKLQSDDDLACLVDEAVLATINHQRQTFGKTIRVFPTTLPVVSMKPIFFLLAKPIPFSFVSTSIRARPSLKSGYP